MSTKTVVLITIALLLGAAYVYWFTDWFQSPTIQILALTRPTNRGGRPVQPNQVLPVSFAFSRKYRLTELRVVAVEDEKTNKRPHALWHLISDSNSVPTKAIIYGDPIRGMKPKIPRAKPEVLQPEVLYRLHVRAESKHEGQIDFQTKTLVPLQ